MPLDPSILLHSQPVQVPDPMALATNAMNLGNLATGMQMKNYLLQDSMRKDAATQALGKYLPDLQANGFDQASMQRALQDMQDPDARAALLDRADAFGKAQAATQESQAKAFKERNDAMAKGYEQLGQMAAGAVGKANAQTVASLSFTAQQFGIKMPPFQMGDNPDQYLGALADQATTMADRMKAQSAAYERALQARGQNMTANSAAAGHQVTAMNQDPLHLNPPMNFGGGFDTSTANLGLPGPGGNPMPAPAAGAAPPPQRGPMAFDNTIGLPPDKLAAIQADARQSGFNGAAPAAPPDSGMSSVPFVPPGQQPQQPQQPQQGPGSFGNAMNPQQVDRSALSGDDFLATLPPNVAAMLKGIKNGDIKMPPLGSRSPMAMQLNSLLTQYDPDFNEQNYPLRYAARHDLVPGAKGGDNLKNLDTAVNHAVGLIDSFAQMNNSSSPWLNAPVNAIMAGVGGNQKNQDLQNARANFDVHATGLSGELAKVFRSQGMSVQEVNDWRNNLSENSSPAAMRGAVQGAIEMIIQRYQTIADQQNNAFGTQKTWQDFAPPATVAKMEKALTLTNKGFTGGAPTPTGIRPTTAAGPDAAPAAAAPAAASGGFTTSQVDAMPDPRTRKIGAIAIMPDGSKWVNTGTQWQAQAQQ